MRKAADADARAEKRQRGEEGASWHEGKSRELLLRCFEKELAVSLKLFFTDQDVIWRRRRSSYFRRNYLDVPELKAECEAVLEDINQMAGPRVEEAVAKSGQDVVGRDSLDPHMLKLEETRGHLKLVWPTFFWTCVGDGERKIDDRRPFGSLAANPKFTKRKPRPRRSEGFDTSLWDCIRAALADWWYEDIYAWVVRAEIGITGSQLSRLIFDGRDDHLEIKVTGYGTTAFFALAETDGLEVLARLVEQRFRATIGTSASTGKSLSWTFRITDEVRRARARLLLKRVLEIGSEPGAASKIPLAREAALKSLQENASREGGDVRWLNRLVELKAELGLIPEEEAAELAHERNLCLPFTRVACSGEEPQDDDWIELLRTPALIGSLPSPEDEPLLAHLETSRTHMELEFHGTGEEIVLKVETQARVPDTWKRPYVLIWNTEGGDRQGG